MPSIFDESGKGVPQESETKHTVRVCVRASRFVNSLFVY